MDLTPGQRSVLQAFHSFGPMTDVALAVYVHHVSDDGQSSSSIRSRRCELVRKRLLLVTDTKRMPSGRNAAVHSLSAKGQKIADALFTAQPA